MFRGYIIACTGKKYNLGLVLNGKLFPTMADVKKELWRIEKGLPKSYTIQYDEIDSDCIEMQAWLGGELWQSYKSFPIYC